MGNIVALLQLNENGMFNMSFGNNRTCVFRLWTHILQNMFTIMGPTEYGMSILSTIHIIKSHTRQYINR